MKSQVHKTAVRMNKRKNAVDRQFGGPISSLPTSINGRHFARSASYRQYHAGHYPRQGTRQNDPPDRLPLAGSASVGTFGIELGTAARASSVVTITTGSVNSANVSEAHINPPVPKVEMSAREVEKNELIDLPAQDIAEEAQARRPRRRCWAHRPDY